MAGLLPGSSPSCGMGCAHMLGPILALVCMACLLRERTLRLSEAEAYGSQLLSANSRLAQLQDSLRAYPDTDNDQARKLIESGSSLGSSSADPAGTIGGIVAVNATDEIFAADLRNLAGECCECTTTASTTSTSASTVTTTTAFSWEGVFWRITEGEGSGCLHATDRDDDCIHSRNYPSNYPSRSRCVIEIAPNPEFALSIEDYNVENGNYDKLTIDGITWNGNRGPISLMRATGGDQIVWSTDSSVNRRGWLMCARSTCASFSCPGGMSLKPNASSIACHTNICDSADTVTCCERGCDRPDHLGDDYSVPSGCTGGGDHSNSDCPIACAGDSTLDGARPPQQCHTNGTFSPPGCRSSGDDFPWVIAGPCHHYGPGCVSTIGVGGAYDANEMCVISYDLPDGVEASSYRMELTYLDAQLGDLLVIGGVSVPVSSCNSNSNNGCYDSSLGTVSVNYQSGLELVGTISEVMEFSSLQNFFWTSDSRGQGTGWIMCALATCAAAAECPEGKRYNCDADDQWCQTHDCSSVSDVTTCCVNETQQDIDRYGFKMGEAANASWCIMFTSTTTTTTSSTWKVRPDFIGHFTLQLEALAEGETMESRAATIKTLLNEALHQMASVDALDVQVQTIFINSTIVDVAFRIEQTDIAMDTKSDEEYVDAFNGNENVTLVEAVTHRIMHSPPLSTQDYHGHRRYGGSCTDSYPCAIQAYCWMEDRHWKTCSWINENKMCRPERTPGPDFSSVFNRYFNFDQFLQRPRTFFGQEPLEEVCCSCGGGVCAHGTYRISNDMPTLCIPCPAGSSSFGDDPRECTECEAGRYTDTLAMAECAACPIGQFGDSSGMTGCMTCSAGTIAPVEGLTSCELCPPGTTSNSRFDECIPCSRGFFAADNGTSACEACPEGQYQDDIGMSECLPCGLGSFSGSVGSSACDSCDRGRFTDILGQSACSECRPGQVQGSLGADSCDDCEIGYYARLQGQSECVLCEEGTETRDPGQSECLRCSPGFAKADGELNCTKCDAGSYTTEPGLTACRLCSPGERANMAEAATGCVDCEVGRFSLSTGSTSCTACSAGTYMSEERATSCVDCLAGEFSNVTGGSSCLTCAAGSYSPVAGSAVCDECLPGQEAVQTGLTQCDACVAGSYASAAGTSRCNSCKSGWYSPLQGSTACVSCTTGRYAESEGLSECPFCDAGSYSDREGMTRCTLCSEVLPGEAEFWTTMTPPTDADPARPSGIKEWKQLLGATNSTSCGCRPGTQPYLGGVCEECGEGMICLGMGVLEIEDGYAWDFAYSTWDCEHGILEACPGGMPGRCMPGRNEEAVACAVCLDDLIPRDDGSCVECNDGDFAIPAVCLIFSLVVVVCMYLVFDSPKRKRPKLSLLLIVASLGQAVTIIQQLGIISLIRVQWTNPLMKVFSYITSITFFDLEVLRPRCIAKFDVVRMYAMRVLLVFICLGLVCFAHFMSQLIQHRRTWRTRWPTLFCALGTILLTFFVSILSTMLSPLQCQRHPNTRQTVSWYPSIVCWEGGDHTTMILIGSLACLLPLVFLCLSAWAVVHYPRSLMQGKTRFLNTWAFLFFRYNPEAYWYGPVMLVRNSLVAAVPVLTSAVLQIFSLEVIMLCSLILLLSTMPWRVAKANSLDAVGHFCLILVTMLSAFYVDQDDMQFISTLSVVLISAIPVVLLLVLCWASGMLLRSFLRPFQFFLCHHKQGAGCFCRLLKIYLVNSRGVSRKVFIDSDDLKNLDLLFDVVAHETETLIAVHSQNLLLRPWCIGEITTAHRSQLRMVRISMPGVPPPTLDFIDNFSSYVNDISCLTQHGIELDMVKDALRTFAAGDAIKMPQELFDCTFESLCSNLVAAKVPKDELCAYQTKHNTRPEVLIIANKLDFEAAATAIILQVLINPIIQIQEACLALVLGMGEQVPTSVRKALLLCTNGVFTNHVLQALLSCRVNNAVILPVMCETNFVFPSEAWMREQASFASFAEGQRDKVCRLVQAVFTEIAVDFQPSALSGTEATLNIKAQEIVNRAFGGMTTISDKVVELARKNKDRAQRTPSALGNTTSSTSTPSAGHDHPSTMTSYEIIAAESEFGSVDSLGVREAVLEENICSGETELGSALVVAEVPVIEVVMPESELGQDSKGVIEGEVCSHMMV